MPGSALTHETSLVSGLSMRPSSESDGAWREPPQMSQRDAALFEGFKKAGLDVALIREMVGGGAGGGRSVARLLF